MEWASSQVIQQVPSTQTNQIMVDLFLIIQMQIHKKVAPNLH